MQADSDQVLSLSALSTLISEALEFELEPHYWVEAEVASMQVRGHCYMELVEKGVDGVFAAKLRATCWMSVWNRLSQRFAGETGQALAVGMKVKLCVTVTFHAVYGMALNVLDIDSSVTLGDLAKKRAETLRRLEEMGAMELQPSLTLPTLVRRLAVISSDTAAGYQDFVHQLMEPGFRFTTALYPATMQGDTAAASIISALDAICSVAEEFDAVVIIRGGGATTDLTCFDDYALCLAVAQCPLPVFSGIGHTRDISVLDCVAFAPLKTPTAVADWLIARMDGQMQRIDDLRRRLTQTAQRQILIRRHRLEMLAQRISSCNPERIYRMGYSLLTKDGRVVRSAADLAAGDRITSHLMDGTVESVVS